MATKKQSSTEEAAPAVPQRQRVLAHTIRIERDSIARMKERLAAMAEDEPGRADLQATLQAKIDRLAELERA